MQIHFKDKEAAAAYLEKEKFDGSGETYVGVSITEIEDFIKNNFQE